MTQARFTLLCGYVFLLLAFPTMLLLWKEGAARSCSGAAAGGRRAYRRRPGGLAMIARS